MKAMLKKSSYSLLPAHALIYVEAAACLSFLTLYSFIPSSFSIRPFILSSCSCDILCVLLISHLTRFDIIYISMFDCGTGLWLGSDEAM